MWANKLDGAAFERDGKARETWRSARCCSNTTRYAICANTPCIKRRNELKTKKRANLRSVKLEVGGWSLALEQGAKTVEKLPEIRLLKKYHKASFSASSRLPLDPFAFSAHGWEGRVKYWSPYGRMLSLAAWRLASLYKIAAASNRGTRSRLTLYRGKILEASCLAALRYSPRWPVTDYINNEFIGSLTHA